ncbi:hypothetical protein E2C01_062090 [Portunus trituberculatus]|uniref:Uncharacterized protein n=1 Tax=Portunus trituberculatus TaxID=210409 RepID=A0A5B7HH28_PORTR|nr:hypothetical protein [Portunus trituberculatus]
MEDGCCSGVCERLMAGGGCGEEGGVGDGMRLIYDPPGLTTRVCADVNRSGGHNTVAHYRHCKTYTERKLARRTLALEGKQQACG